MNRINIQLQASSDAVEAADWYERPRGGLGAEFILELDAALERAALSPDIYALQYRDARRVLLRKFPYAVYFVCENSAIEIFAILHQRRSDAPWQNRIR